MKFSVIILAAFVSIGALVEQAHADDKASLPNKVETPKQQIEMDNAIERMNGKNTGYVTDMKFYCDHEPVKIKFDFNLVALANRDNTGGYLNCGYAVHGMVSLCKSNKLYKELLKKHVKDVDCKLLSDPKAVKVSLDKGTLHLAFGAKYNDNKLGSDVAEYLENYKYPAK